MCIRYRILFHGLKSCSEFRGVLHLMVSQFCQKSEDLRYGVSWQRPGRQHFTVLRQLFLPILWKSIKCTFKCLSKVKFILRVIFICVIVKLLYAFFFFNVMGPIGCTWHNPAFQIVSFFLYDNCCQKAKVPSILKNKLETILQGQHLLQTTKSVLLA